MNWFNRGKSHGSLGWLYKGVGYAEVGFEEFYCNNKETILNNISFGEVCK